jgi:hypothetical protein
VEAERELVMEAVHQDTTYLKYAPLRADVYVILDAMETHARESKDYRRRARERWRTHAIRSMTLTSPPRCRCFVLS